MSGLHSEAIRRREWALLACILLLAAVVRLGAPGISEFKRDEANMSQMALDLVEGRRVPLLGLSSSVNVPNPPISVYLFALPYTLDRNPIAATLFVGLLNVLAVALTWALARRWYGSTAALAAGLLYAVSPWAAIYSRKIWAQDLLPPFVVLTVFTGLLGYADNRRWARWLHWPLLAITVQIHYGAFTLIPLSLLMLVLWSRRVHWRDLAIGALLAALTMIPAVVGAYQAGWLSTSAVQERTQTSADHRRVISTRALDNAWLTVAGTQIHSLAGPDQFRRYLDSVPDVFWLFKLVPLAACAGALLLVGRNLRRASRAAPDVMIVAWLVLPVLAFTWEWTEVAPHYMIPLMPAAYLLAGIAFGRLWDVLPRTRPGQWARLGAGGLLIAIAALQVGMFAALLRFVDTHATPGGFGTPLHYLLDVQHAVLDQNPQRVLMISDQELAPYDQEPSVWGVLLDAVPDVRFVDGTQAAVVPAADTLELIAWQPDLRTCPDAACLDRPGIAVFARRPGEMPYALRQASHDLPLTNVTAIDPARFANGAVLTGYAVTADNVALVWDLSGPGGADDQAFVHALGAHGERLAQVDRFAWPGRYWRAGDRLVLWFDLTLPPEAVTLYAGLYTTDGAGYHNVEVLDAAGAYLAQGATIPLTR